MDEQELIRKLNSVGKKIFVEYFFTFQSFANGQLSRENCIELLVSNRVSNENGAAIRCGNATLIFKTKMECRALEIVTESTRLPYNTVDTAQKIIDEYYG